MGGGSGNDFGKNITGILKKGIQPTILANAVFFFGITAFMFRISALGIYCSLVEDGFQLGATWIVLTSIDLLIMLVTLTAYATTVVSSWRKILEEWRKAKAESMEYADDVSLIHKNAGEKSADDSMDNFHHTKRRRRFPVHQPGNLGSSRIILRLFPTFLICNNMFLFISTVVLVATNASILLTHDEARIPKAEATIACEVVGTALTSIYFVLFIVAESMSFSMIAQSVIVMVSVLQFLVAFVCIWINSTSRILRGTNLWDESTHSIQTVMRYAVGFPYFGLVIAASAAIGLTFGISVSAYNRLSDASRSISAIYITSAVTCEIICCVYFAFALAAIGAVTQYGNQFRDLMVADPILGFAGMVLNIVGIMAARSIRRRPQSSLSVEVYDISGLAENQISAWAALIDTYSQLLPGSVSGREALSLMKAYVSSPTPKMHCKVLRVFDANRAEQLRKDTQNDPQTRVPASAKKQQVDIPSVPKYYEQVRAWEQLDRPAIFEDHQSTNSHTDVATLVSSLNNNGAGAGEPMSKKARKKAERKAEKKADKRRSLNVSLKSETVSQQLELVDAETLARNEEFKQTLISTEALILLTCIEDYDLTASLGDESWFSRAVNRTLGSGSALKLLCVRMGLLATHFPFRQLILYTSPTRKPNARAAAVSMAVAEWNSGLPRSERCNMILNPAFKHKGMGDSFKPSGWLTVPLPPSHVIDLRQYHGKTLPEYLKAIKYRNQAVAFNKANGKVIETTDFSFENCKTAVDLWANIAEKRISDGHTAVLANPSVEFLQELGTTANSEGYRSLLFLKIDNVAIASCVLFRLGDTITSDIQGLDHENGRKYKAYFVMMQETIAIALREGISFVDFGPTTAKPKMDIGAKEVDLVGGMWAQSSLAPLVAAFAGQVA